LQGSVKKVIEIRAQTRLDQGGRVKKEKHQEKKKGPKGRWGGRGSLLITSA